MNANVQTLFEGDEDIHDSIVDLVPGPDNPTPIVRLGERFNPHADFDLLVKLEGMNPFGSIKDRTALHMLRGLRLRADQVLVEPSAGNTGIALAAMANAGGAPIEIAVPDGTPEEKKALLRFLGAELIDEIYPGEEESTMQEDLPTEVLPGMPEAAAPAAGGPAFAPAGAQAWVAAPAAQPDLAAGGGSNPKNRPWIRCG